MSSRRRAALCAAYALVTFGSFPHPIAGGVVDLGVVLAWLGPALLVAALRGLAPRRAAGVAFLAGLAGQSLVLHWIFVVTGHYGGVPAPLAVLAPVGLATYTALHVGLFGAYAAALARAGRDGPFALAAGFAAQEWLRHHVFTGFPWGVLGYAQHENGPLMALASYGGVHLLSWITALGGLGIERVVRARAAARGGARDTAGPRAAALALGVVVLAHAFGALSLAGDEMPVRGSVRVAVLQGNVAQDEKWSEAFFEETLRRYERLSRGAADAGAEVIVWPETAVPGSLELDPGFRERLQSLALETGRALVIGGVGVEGRGRHARYFDSAYVFAPDGRITDRYDKGHLVPFGEYIPFAEWIGAAVSAIASGIAPYGVTAGDGPRVLSIERPPAPGADVRDDALPAGVPVCYELLFPDGVRRFARDGAGVLFAITNDAWYGRTGAPYQFLAITALRAAETRTWIARAANTGVSALIDDRGRVREQTPIFEQASLVGDVPLRDPGRPASFYARHGDLVAWACAAAALALLGLARWAPQRAGSAARAAGEGR